MRGYRTGYPQLHSNPYRYALRGIGEEQDRLPHRRYRGAGRLRRHYRVGHHAIRPYPFPLKDSHDLRFPAARRFRFTEHWHRPLQRAVPAGGRVARAVQLLFVPTPSHPRTACNGGTLRPCDLHDGDTHRTGIHVGGTATPADLRNRLTRPYGG